MRHRGMKIIAIKGTECYEGRNHRNEPDFKLREVTVGYSVIGTKYPESVSECKATIDNLIGLVMSICKVSEKEAVKLINEN